MAKISKLWLLWKWGPMKPGWLVVINHYKAAEKEPKMLEHPGGCGCRVPTTDICKSVSPQETGALETPEVSKDSEAWEPCPFGHLTPRSSPSPWHLGDCQSFGLPEKGPISEAKVINKKGIEWAGFSEARRETVSKICFDFCRHCLSLWPHNWVGLAILIHLLVYGWVIPSFSSKCYEYAEERCSLNRLSPF